MMSFEVFQVDNFQKTCFVYNSYNLFVCCVQQSVKIVLYNYNITQKFGIQRLIVHFKRNTISPKENSQKSIDKDFSIITNAQCEGRVVNHKLGVCSDLIDGLSVK